MAEWDPEAYGRVNTLQEYVAQEALAGLELRGDERVLDVGCGDGRVTEVLVDRLHGGSVVGVDPSEAMVAAARARLAGRPRVDFAEGRAATITYADEFDLVTSFNALHWELRWIQALERMRNALRTGGRAFLVFVCAGSRPSVEDVLSDVTQRSDWRSWFTDFTAPFVHVDPDAYAQAAVAAGFGVESNQVVDLRWDFGDRAAFTAWMTAGTVAWTSRLPEQQRAAFVADAVTAYAPISGSESVVRFLQCRISLTKLERVP